MWPLGRLWAHRVRGRTRAPCDPPAEPLSVVVVPGDPASRDRGPLCRGPAGAFEPLMLLGAQAWPAPPSAGVGAGRGFIRGAARDPGETDSTPRRRCSRSPSGKAPQGCVCARGRGGFAPLSPAPSTGGDAVTTQLLPLLVTLDLHKHTVRTRKHTRGKSSRSTHV